MAVFETDDRDSITVSMINSSDDRLSGISGDAAYVVVTGIEKIRRGTCGCSIHTPLIAGWSP